MFFLNLSITLTFLITFNVNSAQETYKYKTTPKIPYESPTDELFINGPFADKIENNYNCSDSRPARATKTGISPEFMPVCALLPAHLVKCNPVYICQHDRYLQEVERLRQIRKQDDGSRDRPDESENATEIVDEFEKSDGNNSFLNLCETRGCITKLDTGPRPIQTVKFVDVFCYPLVSTCCGATSFYRKVPCTLDFETRREFINRKDEAGRKEAAISKVFERELTPISIPNFPNFLMTLMYSIFLGIFGCDRCYLGNRLLGMFKLLSIGGLGFWWMIDTILLIYGVSRPEDGINWDPYF